MRVTIYIIVPSSVLFVSRILMFRWHVHGTCHRRRSDVYVDDVTLESRTSKLRDSRQTACDVMSVLIRSGADVLLANLAYGHDTLPLHAEQLFWHSRMLNGKIKKLEKKLGTFGRLKVFTWGLW